MTRRLPKATRQTLDEVRAQAGVGQNKDAADAEAAPGLAPAPETAAATTAPENPTPRKKSAPRRAARKTVNPDTLAVPADLAQRVRARAQAEGRDPLDLLSDMLREHQAASERPSDAGVTAADDHARRYARIAGAREIAERGAAWAAAGGMIPLPALDLAAVIAVQINMVASLAQHYGVPFERARVRAVLLSVAGGLSSLGLGVGSGYVLSRVTPWGMLLGLAVSSGVAAMATRLVGHAFIMHFETGGTAMTLEPARLKAFLAAAAAGPKAGRSPASHQAADTVS